MKLLIQQNTVPRVDNLKEAVATKRPELVNRQGVLFQHDNARPHVSSTVRNKLLTFDWDILPQPPYSPDNAPCDYYFFLSLKNYIRSKKFGSIIEIEMHLERYFASKPQTFSKDGIIRHTER